MSRDPLRLLLNDREIETAAPPGTVLLDFLRGEMGLKGTKVGCREGDCGACTVLVGELQGDEVVWRNVNSCLTPLANVAGRHVVTVEGLAGGATPTLIEAAMVEEGASQCGFCTPGFVVSLAGHCLAPAGSADVVDAIGGNICRCTGYTAILRAARRVDAAVQAGAPCGLPRWIDASAARLRALGSVVPSAGGRPVGGGTDLYVQRPGEMVTTDARYLAGDPALRRIEEVDGHVVLGASVTFGDVERSPLLRGLLPGLPVYMRRMASQPIRNTATLAGNLANASPIGDMTVFLLALRSELDLCGGGGRRRVPLCDFYRGYKDLDLREGEWIEAIRFAAPAPGARFNFEKVCKRAHLDIASVNAAACWTVEDGRIAAAACAVGGVAPVPLLLRATSAFLVGRVPDAATLEAAADVADGEIAPISDVRGSADYKRALCRRLLRAHFEAPVTEPARAPAVEDLGPGAAIPNIDALRHARGTARYVDDLPLPAGCLHAQPVGATCAHGRITGLDTDAAARAPGVVAVLVAADVPGENQIGGIIPDEPLLADGAVHFRGQPVALVVAATEAQAAAARALVRVDYEPLPVTVDPREAYAAGEVIGAERTFALGDTDVAFAECRYVYAGRADISGQEHLYIETQGAVAVPAEDGGVRVTSSTQGPTAVQRALARVLGVSMHRVAVEVVRLGGGFGGKEDQATAWAALAGLAACRVQRPVRLVLDRADDLVMTGKRHPYSADFRIGLGDDLKIRAYEVRFFQNAGAAADLSPAVLERTLFHATNSYSIPNVRATAASCRTNLPPFTAFRGFGGPQGMFVMEAAIAEAAAGLGVPASDIQRANLLRDGDVFPYGQRVADCRAEAGFDLAAQAFALPARRAAVAAFNAQNASVKRGVACMPVCFGISFTKTAFNQGRALVHVYLDGSVGVSTGGVEMGQGVHTKLAQVAARCFGIDAARVKIETTDTTRIANAAPSAASATADLNGKAVQLACERITRRLLEVARPRLLVSDSTELSLAGGHVAADGIATELTFEALAVQAFLARVSLSEHAHYATPELHYDPATESGHPFAYHVYGTAIVTAEVDGLRGVSRILSFDVAHDYGESLNPRIDRGQVDGGIVQGMGWMTCEDLRFDADGRLLSDALSTYKVPDVFMTPAIAVRAIPGPPHPRALLGSKAVGEPPLMYGIGAWFALREALRAFGPDVELPYAAPLTPERVLQALQERG